jgi:hypothetical protein
VNPKEPDVNDLMRTKNTGTHNWKKPSRIYEHDSYDSGEQAHRQQMWHDMQQGGYDWGNGGDW